MAKPTRGDAELMLQLVGLLHSAEQADARRWFFKEFKAKDFAEFNKNYPKDSDERRKVSTVLGFFETAGVLVWHGLLNADLFFDLSFGLELVYQKVAPIIPGWQKQAKAPALWENVQWLAERAETWNKTVWKPKVKAVKTSRPRR
ncbi:MAG TPA: hypothetical protein VGU71_13915 [Candidatus Dormibacteraeota bacterium]|nr:hypothetical protein [Candidatus Dormibacteraeota bacterium]